MCAMIKMSISTPPPVAAQFVEQTDLTMSLGLEQAITALPGYTLTGAVAAVYSNTNGDGTTIASFGTDLRGRVEVGYRYQPDNKLNVDTNLFVDGLGSDSARTFGASLQLNYNF